jgi:leucine dehydrogenase
MPRNGRPPLCRESTMIETLDSWDGEELILRRDEPTGATIVLAIHSSRLGPATGGTRLLSYPTRHAAVEDAMVLARAMTLKFALAGFPRGGGKAVLDVPRGLPTAARKGLLQRYGAMLRQLDGRFRSGPDVGVSSEDLEIIAEAGAPWVHALSGSVAGEAGSAGPTAIGVVEAIVAACESVFGTPSLTGRRIVVQGAGHVGSALVELLAEAGASVAVSELDPDVARSVAAPHGLSTIPPASVWDAPCDVLAPCALGGVLNARTIPRLKCRIVAGAANNQLEHDDDAKRLADRGIVWVPDAAASAGGAVAVTGMESLGWSRERALEAVRAIGGTVREILRRAATQHRTTLDAARALASERLAAAERARGAAR